MGGCRNLNARAGRRGWRNFMISIILRGEIIRKRIGESVGCNGGIISRTMGRAILGEEWTMIGYFSAALVVGSG